MSYRWDSLSDELATLLGFVGERTIAVRPSLNGALKGNGNTAILLSQFMYWSSRTTDPEGWFYNTQEELEEQTGIAEEPQRTARKHLVSMGILEEQRRGLPARMYYRINLSAVAELLIQARQTTPQNKNPGNPVSGRYGQNGTSEAQDTGNQGIKTPGTPGTRSGESRELDTVVSSELDTGNQGDIKDSTEMPTKMPTKTAASGEIEEDAETQLRLETEARFKVATQLLKDKLNNRADADGEGTYYSCLLEDPTRIAWLTLRPSEIRELIKQATSEYKSGARFKRTLIDLLDRHTRDLRKPQTPSAHAEVPPPPESLSLEERKKISDEAHNRLPPALRKALAARGEHSVN